MNSLMSPSDMRWAVQDLLHERANYAVYYAAGWDQAVAVSVHEVVDEVVYMATHTAVYDAVYDALWQVLPTQPLHPNIDKLVKEIEQNWSAT